MVAICISIELYEIVQLRSGDGEASTLSLTVGVVGLTLRGVRLLGRFFIKKRTSKKTKNILMWPKNLLRGLLAN